MTTPTPPPITVGKYLISPLIKAVEGGWFSCAVSIRSGTGSATTDRVLRLTRMFRNSEHAADHAMAEGLSWMGLAPLPVH